MLLIACSAPVNRENDIQKLVISEKGNVTANAPQGDNIKNPPALDTIPEPTIPAKTLPEIRSPIEPILQDEKIEEFSIIAKKWEFVPGTITVNQGDIVRLRIISTDVSHGFALPDFNISKTLEPGKEIIIELIADKTGEFIFFCNVPCGSGHSKMSGKLVVI